MFERVVVPLEIFVALEFFPNTCIAGYQMYKTSATMGVPCGCGPGLKKLLLNIPRVTDERGVVSTDLGSSAQ